MGRTTGAVNRDHALARNELANRLAQHLLSGALLPSLRSLAEAAAVDPGTLRHYFEDRSGAIKAALETVNIIEREQFSDTSRLASLAPREGLLEVVSCIVRKWSGLMGRMHTVGLSEGLADPQAGKAYLATVLEPVLAGVEGLLSSYQSRGLLAEFDVRLAVFSFVTPILFACLHQVQLEGDNVRPLDLDAFLSLHVEGFLRGYGVSRKEFHS